MLLTPHRVVADNEGDRGMYQSRISNEYGCEATAFLDSYHVCGGRGNSTPAHDLSGDRPHPHPAFTWQHGFQAYAELSLGHKEHGGPIQP